MKAQQLFSEMEARTEATAWHDQLLHANAATMSRNNKGHVEKLLEEMKRVKSTFSKDMIWNETANAFGYVIIRMGWGFDTAVQRVIQEAREDGLNSDTLPNDIEREMMKGLHDSPEYKAYELFEMN